MYGRAVTLAGTAARRGGVEVAVLAQSFGDGRLQDDRDRANRRQRPLELRGPADHPHLLQGERERRHDAGGDVGVRPAVSLRRIRGARLSTHVGAGKSFAGRFVQLQRLTGGRWVTIRRARLNTASSATFRAGALPHGTSTIRIAMSVNQAGAGYLAGFSRSIHVRRAA